MSIASLDERIAKLKAMRQDLCKKTEEWNKYLELREWLVTNLSELVEQSKSENITKEDIINKLEDLLCVIEPEDENDE